MNLPSAPHAKLRTGRPLKTLLIIIILFIGVWNADAQDTIIVKKASDIIIAKSDTVLKAKSDSGGKSAIEAKVDYKASDSISFEIRKQVVHLYTNAEIAYEDIGLKSAYLQIDFKKRLNANA